MPQQRAKEYSGDTLGILWDMPLDMTLLTLTLCVSKVQAKGDSRVHFQFVSVIFIKGYSGAPIFIFPDIPLDRFFRAKATLRPKIRGPQILP